MDFLARQRRLQAALTRHKLSSLLVTYLPNVRYLCGFTGSAGAVWVTPFSCTFFTDGRYTEQARGEVQGSKIVILRTSLLPAIGEYIAGKHQGRSKDIVGVEADHISLTASRELSRSLAGKCRLRPAPGLIEQARLIKDAEEIEALRDAVELGASLFDDALHRLRPGVPELEVAAAIEAGARRGGAEAMSFETIVAAGPRSALPHGRASQALIPSSGFVVLDFGVILHGYCSDRTRTVWVGPVTDEAREVYAAVLEAQAAAIARVRPGMGTGKIDQTARNVLKRKGLGKYFTHSTGHGVGLEIHEAPRIAKGREESLQAGMVITIEPGAYLPGRWGVRIEDMVLVTEKGCEVLTPAKKDFIAI
jgi:Xaa-Pro aminopeptidase